MNRRQWLVGLLAVATSVVATGWGEAQTRFQPRRFTPPKVERPVIVRWGKVLPEGKIEAVEVWEVTEVGVVPAPNYMRGMPRVNLIPQPTVPSIVVYSMGNTKD